MGISRLRMIPLQISRLPPACCLLPLCFNSGVSAVSQPCHRLGAVLPDLCTHQSILLMEQSWVWGQKTHMKTAHTERARGLWALLGSLQCLLSSAEMGFQYFILSKLGACFRVTMAVMTLRVAPRDAACWWPLLSWVFGLFTTCM